MIQTSTTDGVPFTPPWREGAPDAPKYYLRAGSVIERGQVEAELSGPHRAGRVFGFDLREAVRAGVNTLLANDPDREQVLELLDAEGEGDDVELSEADKKILSDVREILGQHWKPFMELEAQIARRRELTPIVAFRRFCTGIDATGVEFALGRDGLVAESTLATIDPLELMVAGSRAYSMLYPQPDAAGNSPPPPQSAGGRKTSKSGVTSKAGGRSGRRPGRKTRASRSPTGPSPS